MKLSNFIRILAMGLWMVSCAGSDEEIVGKDEKENEQRDWVLTREIELSTSEIAAMDNFKVLNHSLMVEAAHVSDDGGFCLSPISTEFLLGMMANASDGDLRHEILEAFHTEDIAVLNNLYEKMMHYLPCDKDGSALGVFNRFWIQSPIRVPSQTEELMFNTFNAAILPVDFMDESAVISINEWAYETTNGKIPAILLGPWTQYADTQLLCANTVYFKGDWVTKFDREDTTLEGFHSVNGEREVSMMHRLGMASYSFNDYSQSVKLPFDGYNNVMELYLPDPGIDIRQFVEMFTPEMEKEMAEVAQIYMVDLSMPTFRSEDSVDLLRILNNIGISSISSADFSPMGIGKTQLYPFQRTSLKVDEDGAELASVNYTTIGAAPPSGDKPIVMNFNRPFFYVIRNAPTGAVLMVGTVTDI